MGYTTEFEGELTITPDMKPEHARYINAFCASRRMKRNAEITETLPDPLRLAVGLPIGKEGAFFVESYNDGSRGQKSTPDIVNYNEPPSGQPGLWCKWEIIPTPDASDTEPFPAFIHWNGMEKFYDYLDWMKYIVNNFLKPWGYVVNGKIRWRGENMEDIGIIVAKNNKITAKEIDFS